MKHYRIERAYIRHYRDSGQTTAYVEWGDGSRTEGRADKAGSFCPHCEQAMPSEWLGHRVGAHMSQLFAHFERQNGPGAVTFEEW